jgi:hypothetical protein
VPARAQRPQLKKSPVPVPGAAPSAQKKPSDGAGGSALRVHLRQHTLYALSDSLYAQGAAEKIKRENDVHLRQLAKKSTYVPTFFFFFKCVFGRFSARGVRKHEKKNEYVSKKNRRGNIFSGGIFSG